MNILSLHAMTQVLTLPYQRGAETLDILLGEDVGGWTEVADYDFQEYRARYDVSDPPNPKYILLPRQKIGEEALVIEVEYLWNGSSDRVILTIPPDTFANTSFLIPLPEDGDASLRLQRFRQLGPALSGSGQNNWLIVAILGNIAKLAWILGWEKEHLRQQILDVQQQRFLPLARRFSLDQLGRDLQIPRFPPREYSFDPDTIALYHCQDLRDETSLFGLSGHPLTNNGALFNAIGKFGEGIEFSGSSSLEIPDHPDFNLTTDRSLTVETFLKVESSVNPRFLITKQVGAGVGWSLGLDNFNNIANNLHWTGTDGVTTFNLWANIDLVDGQFHHLAVIIDRPKQLARLYIDGEERNRQDITQLGVISNTEPIRLGSGLVGVMDEVRFSQVARLEFAPVLGEGDRSYRQRLAIFERWFLPTPEAIIQTLNRLVKVWQREVNGFTQVGNPFVLVEQNRPLVSTSQLLRIVPKQLAVGERIDAQGNINAEEPDFFDPDFQEFYLFRHDRLGVDYGSQANHRLMQATTQQALDSLLSLLTGVGGNLVILKSFEPTEPRLHRFGLALLLEHTNLSLEELALFAHRAGFDFVRNTGTQVYASAALGEKLLIDIAEPPPFPGVDVISGQGINLQILPNNLPTGGQIQWTLISCGEGQARFTIHPSDDPNLKTPVRSRPRLRLLANSPGVITVRVEYTYQRRTVTGTRTLRIGINSLEDGASITSSGKLNVSEAQVIADLNATVPEIYLINHDRPNVDYQGDDNHHLMQLGLEKPLNLLLELLTGTVGQLIILQAYDPNAQGLYKAGRALRFQHTNLGAESLGAYSHRAGFDFVQRSGGEIYASVNPSDKIAIVQSSNLLPLEGELSVGETRQVQGRFSQLPPDGDYNWGVDGSGLVRLSFTTRSPTTLTPLEPGLVYLTLTYLEADPQTTLPYSVEIRLKSELDVAEVILPKEQYDLVMNLLNYFHPLGVEVITTNIRAHVVELADPSKLFPDYTYPDFRI